MSKRTFWFESVCPKVHAERNRVSQERASTLSGPRPNTSSNSSSSNEADLDTDDEELLSIEKVISGIHTPYSTPQPWQIPQPGIMDDTLAEKSCVQNGGSKPGDPGILQTVPTSHTHLLGPQPNQQSIEGLPYACYGALSLGEEPLPPGQSNYFGRVAPISPRTGTNNAPPCREEDRIETLPFFLVNIVLMSVYVSNKFHGTLLDQYVYHRYAIDMLGNDTDTASDPCFPAINQTSSDLVEKVQEMSSQQLLYLDLVLYGLGIPSIFVLGMLSRTIDRRTQLLIPLFGYTFKCAALVVVIHLSCSLDWIYLAYCIEGLTGNVCSILLGVFLYTSDITSRSKSRTIAMVFVEGSKGLATSFLSVVNGKLIQDRGFLLPAYLSLAAASTGLLLVFLLPNRKQKTRTLTLLKGMGDHNLENSGNGNASGYKSWYSALLFPSGTFDNFYLKRLFISGYAGAFFTVIAMVGIKKIQTLYLMDRPTCWSSASLGWFSFASDFSVYFFAMFLGPCFIRCFPGMIMGIVGNISNMGGYLVYAFAKTSFQTYFEPLVAIAHQLPMGLIRGELSRLVGPESQGTLFSTIAAMESLSFALGTQFLYIYNITLELYKPAVMFLAAGLAVFATLILVYFHIIWKKYYSGGGPKVIEVMVTTNSVKNINS